MGLDSYLYKAKVGDTSFEGPNLVGGLLSGNGQDGSFRGKVYDGIVERASGLSLYVEAADNQFVEEIADSLEDFLASHEGDEFYSGEYTVSRQEVEDLAKLFRQAADKGCVYAGWW